MTRPVKLSAAATLQLGLIASIGSFVGWPYMQYVLYATIAAFLLTLIFLVYDLAKNDP